MAIAIEIVLIFLQLDFVRRIAQRIYLLQDKPASGRKADVVRAAYTALDAAMRMMKGAVEV